MKFLIALAILLAPCHTIISAHADWSGPASLPDVLYARRCSFAVGDDMVNHIWFNDTDGDCRTRDWYLEIVLPDGKVFVARSSDERRPLEWDLTGKLSCCLSC